MAKSIHDNRYRWMIEQLVQARKALGLTQEKLAARLARPQQFVSRYEVGERRLDMIEFLDVAAILEMDGLKVAAEAMKRN